jgi:RNA polymerase sigma factor (sigma-70 family)
MVADEDEVLSVTQTSFHVRRAIDGDGESLGWIVERLSPLLRMQAEYRIPERLRSLYDPQDVVADVWLAAMPKLGSLSARSDRWTPVLVRYLSTAVLRRVNELYRKHLLNKPLREAVPEESSVGLNALPAPVSGAITRAERGETQAAVREAIEGLEAKEREIVILRGIEQLTNLEASDFLGETPGTLAMRYHRAMARLRARIPRSVFDELDDGTGEIDEISKNS